MSQDARTLLLVDGFPLCYQAFYALPAMTGPDNVPIQVVHGTLSSLLALLEKFRPTHVVVAFDPKGKTHRHEAYEAYKANRSPMPEEMKIQIPILIQTLEEIGLPVCVVDGYEADDVLGTLAQAGRESGIDVVVASRDME